MKAISTLLFVLVCVASASAQWSNTTNVFADSLHMPVSAATGDQNHSLSIMSYPDSGYILYWEDHRGAKANIYAQKFDKGGHALWAANGIPVAGGTNDKHFYSSTNGDYRYNSFAATDSAGGFYITYLDDSVTNYSYQRVTVQHVLSNATPVFPGAGYVVAATPSGTDYNYTHQQLIADGNKGFYLAFIRTTLGAQDVYADCFRDENGTMKYYGGGEMNFNDYLTPVGSCPGNYTLDSRDAYAHDFYLYTDWQGGCNVVMTLEENAGGNDRLFVGYNRLVRVKKTSTIVVTDPTPATIRYPKDSVLVFYQPFFHTYDWECGVGNATEIGTGYILDGNGYLRITNLAYGQSYPKGIIIPTDGNISANVITVDQRAYVEATNSLTNYFTLATYRLIDKYDSIPYEYTVFPYRPSSFTGGPAPGQNKINYEQDTILYSGSSSDYDYSLAVTGNTVFLTAASFPTGSYSLRNIMLQQLKVEKQTADSFAVHITSGSNLGKAIGKEVATGFTGTQINYENPSVVATSDGNALFYINEVGRNPRVSPIINATELAWGAMGRPIGSGRDVHGYYTPTSPFVTVNRGSGTGVINWDDGRGSFFGQGENIYMLHLDSLNLVAYTPPPTGPKPLVAQQSYAFPVTLLGSSNAWTAIEAFSGTTGSLSTVAQILDNYNLGAVQTQTYENLTGAGIRTYNGVPYLDRNLAITPENNPGGSGNIGIRLFFTNDEFSALQAADPSIKNPGFLAVVKQPNATGFVPDSYTPVSGEEVITPTSWAAVAGGYYLEMTIHGFSNFFIQKGSVPLPVTWLGIQAVWKDAQNATVSWQVADQQHVKDYTVQQSVNGKPYIDVCAVNSSDRTSYSCIVPASSNGRNEYRVSQQDLDGKKNYSKVVVLQAAASTPLSIYPNPAKDILYINGLDNYTEISILDGAGHMIGHASEVPGASSVNCSQLARGLYFLRLTKDTGTQIITFMKE